MVGSEVFSSEIKKTEVLMGMLYIITLIFNRKFQKSHWPEDKGNKGSVGRRSD